MILSVEGNPVNGIDVARWQGTIREGIERTPEWLQLMGIKAYDAKSGVDPEFRRNRAAAQQMEVPWVPLYCFLREPDLFGDMTDQIARFCQTVGRLAVGECVMLDWERHGISLAHIQEAERIMQVVYEHRWIMYVNDASPDMISWMNANLSLPETERIPIVHPDWQEAGWQAAERWDAAVWQVSVADPTDAAWFDLAFLYPNASAIDVDWVRKPEVMDSVCGRTWPTRYRWHAHS